MSFLWAANQPGRRRPISAAIHSRAWLTAEKSIAGRVPSGVERAFSVILMARIGLPSVDVPICSSFITSGFALAIARSSSAMPPASM